MHVNGSYKSFIFPLGLSADFEQFYFNLVYIGPYIILLQMPHELFEKLDTHWSVSTTKFNHTIDA